MNLGHRDAWNKCKGLSQLEAERLYVDALIRVRSPFVSEPALSLWC